MFARWDSMDRLFPLMDQMRRQMDTLWAAYDDETGSGSLFERDGWPRATLRDDGSALYFRAEVPGLSDKDVTLSLHQDVLTVAGERKVTAPEGYQAHRRDRPAYRFSRSVALPSKVDAEKVTATVKNGVLTVHLPKVPEAQPRQISVRAD